MKQALKFGMEVAGSIMNNFTVQELKTKEEFVYYHGVFMTGLQRLYEKNRGRGLPCVHTGLGG